MNYGQNAVIRSALTLVALIEWLISISGSLYARDWLLPTSLVMCGGLFSSILVSPYGFRSGIDDVLDCLHDRFLVIGIGECECE
jgi:hypothetical protein